MDKRVAVSRSEYFKEFLRRHLYHTMEVLDSLEEILRKDPRIKKIDGIIWCISPPHQSSDLKMEED